MIVCLCRGLSETALQRFIADGAVTLRHLAEVCGAGMDCGACCPAVQELVACAHRGGGDPVHAHAAATEGHR